MALTRVESGPEPDVSSFVTLAQAFSLDPGEREALLVARERPNAWLLSDDAAARLAAQLLGIRAHGTGGLSSGPFGSRWSSHSRRARPSMSDRRSFEKSWPAATRVSSRVTHERRLHRAA